MKNTEIYTTVKEYLIKNPTLNFTELADLIIEDGAITGRSHRTLRKDLSDVSIDLANGQQVLDFDVSAPVAMEEDFELDESVPILKVKASKARIAFLDIETAPAEVYAFHLGKTVLNIDQVKNDGYILGWCGKWADGTEIIRDFLTPAESIAKDDYRITASAFDFVNSADILIGHNIDEFDLKVLGAAFIAHGFDRPLPCQTVDTYKGVVKSAKFLSAKLQFLAEKLTNEKKISTNFKLWKDCAAGDPAALLAMETYCAQDITALEELYYAVRPHIKGHPNVGLYDIDIEHAVCPTCGGFELLDVSKLYTTSQSGWQMVRCSDCGTPGRLRKSVVTAEKRKNMVVALAR
jgi:hypothetical protein